MPFSAAALDRSLFGSRSRQFSLIALDGVDSFSGFASVSTASSTQALAVSGPMATKLVRKCRCASETHGHKPGECINLATEPERLCKPCYDKTSEELKDTDRERDKEDERKQRGRSGLGLTSIRRRGPGGALSKGGMSVCGT
jgi:hypothetical protein